MVCHSFRCSSFQLGVLWRSSNDILEGKQVGRTRWVHTACACRACRVRHPASTHCWHACLLPSALMSVVPMIFHVPSACHLRWMP